MDLSSFLKIQQDHHRKFSISSHATVKLRKPREPVAFDSAHLCYMAFNSAHFGMIQIQYGSIPPCNVITIYVLLHYVNRIYITWM